MKLLDTTAKHFDAAIKEARSADDVIGSTFGMFLRSSESKAQEFLGSFEGGTFIVGLYPPTWCKENCNDCMAKYQRGRKFLRRTQDHNPQHDWIETPQWHTKSLCFKKGSRYSAIIGSRNLGDSGWDDIGVLVHGELAKLVYQHTKKAIAERKK